MTKYPHLKNAPIHEALIDVRVAPLQSFKISKFLELKSKLKKEFPVIEECWEVTGGFEINPQAGVSQNIQRKPQGYWFKGLDGQKIAQFRTNGFTFNKLRPYSSWEEISKEAQGLWKLYESKTGAVRVTRLAVRYINHIDLSLPLENINQHFTICPRLPGDLKNPIKGFMNRVVSEESTDGIESTITQASQQGASEGLIRILLDIDVFKRMVDHEKMRVADMWKTLETLRDIKNRIFFSSVNPSTIEKYK